MTRKENEKDSERPHYYSQFWLDVAAGRRIIGAPKTSDDGDFDQEPEPEVTLLHNPLRGASSDGYHETMAHPEVEPDLEADLYADAEPENEDVDLDAQEEEEEEDLALPMVVDEAEIPDVDFAPLEEEEESEPEEDLLAEEEEEEEEEESGWSATRGRKKPKPGRQAKLPPKKPIKRDSRRSF